MRRAPALPRRLNLLCLLSTYTTVFYVHRRWANKRFSARTQELILHVCLKFYLWTKLI
jgi:hypothetical protein